MLISNVFNIYNSNGGISETSLFIENNVSIVYCTLLHFLEIECPPPPVVPHSTMLLSSLTIHSVVEYTCVERYIIAKGNGIITCGVDGTWNGNTLECIGNQRN